MDNESKGSDPYEAVIADLTAQRERIDQAIALLQNLRALGAAMPPGGFGMTSAAKPDLAAKGAGLGPGAFLGMTIPDAAKKLLLHERRQMGNAEILQELRKGGLVLTSTDPLNTVGSVLNRRFKEIGDVVRVGRGTWGLKEWYPNRTFKVAPKGEDASPMIGKAAVAQDDLDFNSAPPQTPPPDVRPAQFAEEEDDEF